MKTIKVSVCDRRTLLLEENGTKGDVIDLTQLESIDYASINKIFDDGLDKIYSGKITELKKVYEAQKNEEIEKIKGENNLVLEKKNFEIESLKKENANVIKVKELENKKEIEKLNSTITFLNENRNLDIEKEKLTLDAKYQNEISQLKSQIELQKSNLENEFKLSLEKNANDLREKTNKEIAELNNRYNEQLREKDNEINKLTFLKAVKNVKQTGEDLEAWCNNEMITYMQNGFTNCTWSKDNDVVKNDGETKGSKADFILRVFLTDKHNPNEELTAICMDMKDENPDSLNKRTNESYYKDLDKNRKKKNCKYAVLVSNLELDKPNLLPIYRVLEYEDMYVVRPEYMATFLNIVVSLTNKFRDVIINVGKEKIEFKSSLELAEEFEHIKNTYLEKPLDLLKGDIANISKAAKIIIDSSTKIEETCNHITNKYIEEITNKIERFNIKSIKKKLENINKDN